MEGKLVELVLVAGGLWLLWRSAHRVGAQARAGRAAEEAQDPGATEPGAPTGDAAEPGAADRPSS